MGLSDNCPGETPVVIDPAESLFAGAPPVNWIPEPTPMCSSGGTMAGHASVGPAGFLDAPPCAEHFKNRAPHSVSTTPSPNAPGNDPDHCPGTWLTILNLLNSPRSPFGRYLRLLMPNSCHVPSELGTPESSSNSTLLPMPIPFRNAETAMATLTNSSSRSLARTKHRIIAQMWANRIIALCNFFQQGHLAFKTVHMLSQQAISIFLCHVA